MLVRTSQRCVVCPAHRCVGCACLLRDYPCSWSVTPRLPLPAVQRFCSHLGRSSHTRSFRVFVHIFIASRTLETYSRGVLPNRNATCTREAIRPLEFSGSQADLFICLSSQTATYTRRASPRFVGSALHRETTSTTAYLRLSMLHSFCSDHTQHGRSRKTQPA